jgi:hypothetical protein
MLVLTTPVIRSIEIEYIDLSPYCISEVLRKHAKRFQVTAWILAMLCPGPPAELGRRIQPWMDASSSTSPDERKTRTRKALPGRPCRSTVCTFEDCRNSTSSDHSPSPSPSTPTLHPTTWKSRTPPFTHSFLIPRSLLQPIKQRPVPELVIPARVGRTILITPASLGTARSLVDMIAMLLRPRHVLPFKRSVMGIQQLPSGPDVPAVGGADGGLDDVDVVVGCVGDCVVEVVFGGVFGTADTCTLSVFFLRGERC